MQGMLPLHEAIWMGLEKTSVLLLKNTCSFDHEFISNLLTWAASKGIHWLVGVLVDKGVDPNRVAFCPHKPFFCDMTMCCVWKLSIAVLLVDAGCNPSICKKCLSQKSDDFKTFIGSRY
ncbi:unnamed protein product [Laminaria digitata]